MMKGYDREKAIKFMMPLFQAKEHPELYFRLPELLPQMIDADMAYMHESGVLDEDGYAGDAYYEDDEAMEYMVEKLVELNDLTPDQAVKLAALVDDYMDFQQAFLESSGMVEWED